MAGRFCVMVATETTSRSFTIKFLYSAASIGRITFGQQYSEQNREEIELNGGYFLLVDGIQAWCLVQKLLLVAFS